MNAAAVAALHGIPPLALLRTRDPLEQMVTMAVLARCEEIQRRRSNDMARAIVMGLSHVLFGGSRG